MVELLSQDFEGDHRDADIQNRVAVTWLISFQRIRKSCALAAKYLSFISCIDPCDIPLSLPPLNQS